VKSIISMLLGPFLGLYLAPAVAAQWTLHEVESNVGDDYAQAVQINDAGNEIKVFRDADAQVFLEFKISPGFSGLSRSSCPTFQIDRRVPMHYFDVDQSCYIEPDRAVYDLGQIRNNTLTSLVVHRLMNGGKVAFRYLTQDGTYHESRFALSQSKQTLTSVLGEDTRITPY
jgi:hypothetical protein